ncbi:hypothetical protein VNO78_31647 [Psophocarpus tetragonolobus]|uniref:40S ribosomal protein S4 n=1 Tax=Psophocarpus tetragonolobus TaxID=3891 RepID=A0AAN9RYQ9_PSOTE
MENLAQVAGLNAMSVANMVITAAHNARSHRRNCERMAAQVRMIGNLLETLKSTEVAQLPATKEPLDGLEETLRRALDLVESCKDKSYLYMLAMGWTVVNQFRHVQAHIDRYLRLVPLISLVHHSRMQHFSEEVQREYTLDEEEMETQCVILKTDRSKKDACILEKSLSRRYPDLGFHEALKEEKEKLYGELHRSRTNNDPELCRVIEHLIEVTKNVVNVSPNKKLTKSVFNEPTDFSRHITENAIAFEDLELESGDKSQTKWKTDLFGCYSEPCLCLKTCFFPCGTFSWISNVVTRGETSRKLAMTNLVAYSIFCGCCCYSCCIRKRLRSQFNIEGGLCDDFLTHLLCCCCAMVQEWRELKLRGFGGSINLLNIRPNYHHHNTLPRKKDVPSSEPAYGAVNFFFLFLILIYTVNQCRLSRRSTSLVRKSTMARGLKKHLKRLNAPKHWMLDKLGGAFAPKPSSGPHKSRECLPLILILRNRLKYALTYREVIAILMQRHVLVDGKVRTDKTYPAGFMDVVSIPKTNENFRLLYDTKGRFRLHSVRDDEAKFKLCKVRSVQFGQKGIPYLNTYDGRTIRYPDPAIRANDTIKLDLEENKIVDFIKFDVGNVVMVTGGRNRGRVGVIKNREKHKGSFETIHVQDATGHEFATRMGNVFTIGKGTKPWVSLPKGKGIKLSIIEEARKRIAAQQATAA